MMPFVPVVDVMRISVIEGGKYGCKQTYPQETDDE